MSNEYFTIAGHSTLILADSIDDQVRVGDVKGSSNSLGLFALRYIDEHLCCRLQWVVQVLRNAPSLVAVDIALCIGSSLEVAGSGNAYLVSLHRSVQCLEVSWVALVAT